MPYDHARKAGNLGDVWKHFVLVTVVDEIAVPDRFCYVDLHSGAPVHPLQPAGEWTSGIGGVLQKCAVLQRHGYFEIASDFVRLRQYPAGWRFVAERLGARCPVVDVVLTDVAKDVAAHYVTLPVPGVRPNVTMRFCRADGFRCIQKVTAADLVFIDPPFSPDAAKDWKNLTTACRMLLERRISFLAWYPLFWPTNPQYLVDATRCRSWEVTWARLGLRPSQNLKGCGMLASPGLTQILQSAEASFTTLASCMGGKFSVRSYAA